ncbi:hypothetical protein CFC21_057547, partial [Triticum aestivum]
QCRAPRHGALRGRELFDRIVARGHYTKRRCCDHQDHHRGRA